MALSRTRKVEILESYQGGLSSTTHAFLLSFKGVTVPQVTEMRNRVRAAGGSYVVVKNTLALRAITGNALDTTRPHFKGMTAVAYTTGDPVALAKALVDYAKDVPAFEFKGGVLEGQALDAAQIKDVASMPGRKELIAKLLFLLQSPVTRFVRVLAAVPRDFVVVLDQVRAKKEQTSA
jgi:large subunit ribosomal protein L10